MALVRSFFYSWLVPPSLSIHRKFPLFLSFATSCILCTFASRINHSRIIKKKQKTNLATFITSILPSIEALERSEDLLIVTPGVSTDGELASTEQGIVLSAALSSSISSSYVTTLVSNVEACGGVAEYYDFMQRNPKWAARHNPDRQLLDICQAARLVIAYRMGTMLGTAEYRAEQNRTADAAPSSAPVPSNSLDGLSLESRPLFITMMGYSSDGSESVPHSVGFELGGIITLEEYHPEAKTEKQEL